MVQRERKHRSQLARAQLGRENEPSRRMPAPGFATLSAVQTSDPDLQIYRRFNELASRNLVYIQSELAALEAEIAQLDEQDARDAEVKAEGWMEDQLPARCWELLERNANDATSERDVHRMSLVRKLRALMEEYQDALLRQSRVLKLEDPASRSRATMSKWFARNRPLIGRSFDLLDSSEAQNDLVALATLEDQDRLTAFLQNYAGYYLQSKPNSDRQWEGIDHFPDKTIHLVVSIVGIVITAALLVGAIVALSFAESDGLKLGLVALFTTVFAAGIGLLTNARKEEVYAATAA